MIFKLSIRLFLREVKSGYLTSMLVSLILAITIVSGISLFTDRLEKALNSETEEFLGGKLKFESNNNDLFERINESYKDSQHTEMALFASVIFSDDEMQLSSIKAVDDSYPIIGELELKNSSKMKRLSFYKPSIKVFRFWTLLLLKGIKKLFQEIWPLSFTILLVFHLI